MDLSQRLDEMELAIHKPSFRKGTGRANEVNYWVFDYPPEKELEVRERVEYLKNKNDRGDDDFELVVFDLYDMKPYITKKFMVAPCIKEQDIQAICQILLPRYKNVQLMQGLTNNKPDFRIQVKGLFGTEEKRFEVVGGDKKRPATKKKSDLGWIDRLEEIDAALDDF